MDHVPLKDEAGRQIGHVLVDLETGFMTGVVTDPEARRRIFEPIGAVSIAPYSPKPEPTIRPSRLGGITTLPEHLRPATIRGPRPDCVIVDEITDAPAVHRVKAYLDGKLAEGGIVTGGRFTAGIFTGGPLISDREGPPERIIPLPGVSREVRATLGQHIAWHSPDVAADGCLYCERAHSEIPRCVERKRFEGTTWRCSLAAGHGHTLEGDGHDYTTPEPRA